MKFQLDGAEGANLVSRHEPGRVWVGAQEYAHSVLVPWSGPVQAWGAASYELLTAAHFERVAAFLPEVVIFGTGARLRFPKPEWLRSLVEHRIGFETMDTAAACRTYNVLVSERRNALAALLLGEP